MKKAIAYVDKAELFLALKIPFGLEVIAMEYPGRDGSMKITLQGDRLPVDDLIGKKLPEVSYEMRGTWHQARVEPIKIEEPEPVMEIKVAPDKIDLMKSPFDKQVELDEEIEIITTEDVNHGKKRRKTKKK